MGQLVPTALATTMCPRRWPAARWRGLFAITCREFLRCSDIRNHSAADPGEMTGWRSQMGVPILMERCVASNA